LLGAGTTIGTYRVVKKLGEGGMGTVYLGEHTLLGRPAAIKVLLPSLSTNDEIVARFFNEARAVTRIADPGIIQVFDFGHQPEVGAFIVMELLEGESMDGRLKRVGRVGVLETVRFMRLICGSIGAAHAKGIVHRDLKPENLFIVKDPGVPGGERPKILDFGIAKLAGDEPGVIKTRTGALMGTPMFMSPEQCSGSGVVDHRSDIYSLGCVMFAMLTGRPPFHGPGAGDLIAAHLREPPPFAASRVPGLPGAIEGILQRCLTKSPDGRFQSMAELGHEIAAVEHALLASDAVIPAARPPDPTGWPAAPVVGALNAMPGPGMSATPASVWAGVNLSNPTTLRDGSGEASGRMRTFTASPLGRRRVVGLITAAVLVVGAVAIVAQWRSSDGGPRVDPPGDASPPPPSIDASIDASPDASPGPSPAVDAAAAFVSEISDAGVPDAPSPPPAVDAAVALPHGKPRDAGAHPPTTGGNHVGSAGSAARPPIHRED
jgi:serine/threonine protein kinase